MIYTFKKLYVFNGGLYIYFQGRYTIIFTKPDALKI